MLERLIAARGTNKKKLSEEIGRQEKFISDLIRRPEQTLKFTDAQRIAEVLGSAVGTFLGDDGRLKRLPADGLSEAQSEWTDAPAPVDEALLTRCIELTEAEFGSPDSPDLTARQKANLIAMLYQLSLSTRTPNRADVIRLARIAGG